MKEYLVMFDKQAKELASKSKDAKYIETELLKILPKKSRGEFLVPSNIKMKYLERIILSYRSESLSAEFSFWSPEINFGAESSTPLKRGFSLLQLSAGRFIARFFLLHPSYIFWFFWFSPLLPMPSSCAACAWTWFVILSARLINCCSNHIQNFRHPVCAGIPSKCRVIEEIIFLKFLGRSVGIVLRA